jgi:hypothetical protein
LEGHLEGQKADRTGGRWEGPRADRWEDPTEGQKADRTGGRWEGPRADRWEGHWADRMEGRLVVRRADSWAAMAGGWPPFRARMEAWPPFRAQQGVRELQEQGGKAAGRLPAVRAE